MRTRGTVATLAAAVVVAAAFTTAPQATQAGAAAGCAPTWKLVSPPSPSGSTEAGLSGASVVSDKDAWFPETAYFSHNETAGMLHWNGHALSVAAAIPQNPLDFRSTGAAALDSTTDGWMLGSTEGSGLASPQYAAQWSGGQWTITPLAVNPDPTSATQRRLSLIKVASVSPSNAWAVGAFYNGLLPTGTLIEHWDGTQWSIVPNPASSQPGDELDSITVVSPTSIWAVGQQNATGTGEGAQLIEHWDGTAWSLVPAPTTNNPSSLHSVSADGPDDAWAVGYQAVAGWSGGPPPLQDRVGLVEHWDGTSWSVVTSLPDLANSELDSVYAASPSDVWATVYTVRANTDDGVQDFLHWDGTSWSTVPVPGPQQYGLDYEYAGIDGTGPDNIWAAGYSIHEPSGTQTPLVAHLSCG